MSTVENILKYSNYFYNLSLKKNAAKTIQYPQSTFDEIKKFALSVFASWANSSLQKSLNFYLNQLKTLDKNDEEKAWKVESVEDKIKKIQYLINFNNNLNPDLSIQPSSFPGLFNKNIDVNLSELPDNYPKEKMSQSPYSTIEVVVNITGKPYPHDGKNAEGLWNYRKSILTLNFYGTHNYPDSIADYKARMSNLDEVIGHELKHVIQSMLSYAVAGQDDSPKIYVKPSKEVNDLKNLFLGTREGFRFDKNLSLSPKWPEIKNFTEEFKIKEGDIITKNFLIDKVSKILDERAAKEIPDKVSKIRGKKKKEEAEDQIKDQIRNELIQKALKFMDILRGHYYYLNPAEFDTWIHSCVQEFKDALSISPKYIHKILNDEDVDIKPTKNEFNLFVGNPQPTLPKSSLYRRSEDSISTHPFFSTLYIFDHPRWVKAVQKFYLLINPQ